MEKEQRTVSAQSHCAHSDTQERGEALSLALAGEDARGGAPLGASVPSKSPATRIKPLLLGGANAGTRIV